MQGTNYSLRYYCNIWLTHLQQINYHISKTGQKSQINVSEVVSIYSNVNTNIYIDNTLSVHQQRETRLSDKSDIQ